MVCNLTFMIFFAKKSSGLSEVKYFHVLFSGEKCRIFSMEEPTLFVFGSSFLNFSVNALLIGQ